MLAFFYDRLASMSASFGRVRISRDQRIQRSLGKGEHGTVRVRLDGALPIVADRGDEDSGSALQTENTMIAAQLETRTDMVQSVAKRLQEIAELQSRFSNEVVKQKEVIEKLHGEALTATSNIQAAGDSLRRALNRGADFRVTVLAVLLMMSFALLFLDWYMP